MLKPENTPRLETERLLLRKFTRDDCADMFQLYSDEAVNTFLPWFPFQSMEETERYFENSISAEYEKPIAYNYAVVERASGKVIGYVVLCRIDEQKCCADLGYALLRSYWGRGIISEAARAVLRRARENGFCFITATHDVNNPASGGVMKKIGMTYRRSYEEQWQPKNFKVTFQLYQIDF